MEALAKNRRVEDICERITHLPPQSADLKDLCQHIYMILLGYREDLLQDLAANDELDFLVVRLVLNNFRSKKSRYHYLFRVFRERSRPIEDFDFPDV